MAPTRPRQPGEGNDTPDEAELAAFDAVLDRALPDGEQLKGPVASPAEEPSAHEKIAPPAEEPVCGDDGTTRGRRDTLTGFPPPSSPEAPSYSERFSETEKVHLKAANVEPQTANAYDKRFNGLHITYFLIGAGVKPKIANAYPKKFSGIEITYLFQAGVLPEFAEQYPTLNTAELLQAWRTKQCTVSPPSAAEAPTAAAVIEQQSPASASPPAAAENVGELCAPTAEEAREDYRASRAKAIETARAEEPDAGAEIEANLNGGGQNVQPAICEEEPAPQEEGAQSDMRVKWKRSNILLVGTLAVLSIVATSYKTQIADLLGWSSELAQQRCMVYQRKRPEDGKHSCRVVCAQDEAVENIDWSRSKDRYGQVRPIRILRTYYKEYYDKEFKIDVIKEQDGKTYKAPTTIPWFDDSSLPVEFPVDLNFKAIAK